MNDFYRSNASLPRTARSGSLQERLSEWKERRLDHVVTACYNSDDPFKEDFGEYHKIISEAVSKILLTDDIKDETESLLRQVGILFLTAKGGLREATGLIGAEIEKILSD